MNVRGLVWAGSRTRAFGEMVRFLHETLELPIGAQRPGFARLDLPDSSYFEVFDSRGEHYDHFSTGPVVGFEVADFDRARSELESSGCPLLGPEGGERGDYRWQHFRGADGCVFEIVDYPNRPARRAPIGALQLTKVLWMGLSTPHFEATAKFYTDVLGLPAEETTNDLIECRLSDGSSVEAFRRGSEMDHSHFRTGPVPGLGVMDLGEAMRRLRERNVPLIQSRVTEQGGCLLYTSPSPRDPKTSRMPSSA